LTPKFESKIKTAINKLRRQWPAIIACKKRAKVGPELYQCEGCKMLIYTGKRSIDYIQIHHPDAVEGKVDVDHIDSVMPLDGRKLNLIEYVARVFCDIANLMLLCRCCHLSKSLLENEERRKNRKELL
jgi:hypothetical protein